jgi:hypothetical protein
MLDLSLLPTKIKKVYDLGLGFDHLHPTLLYNIFLLCVPSVIKHDMGYF